MTTLAQHTANLERAGLPSVDAIARRILAVFDRATASDVEAGATWYDEAQSLARDLGRNHSTEHAAAVISHLSPRTTWTRNVTGATQLMQDGTQAVGILGANYARALRAFNSPREDLESTFGGPKTRRFFRNISGDTEAVTIDVWAARVADVDEKLLGRKGVYDAVERAYQIAARRRGVTPSTMQATTWVVARNGRAK